MNDAQNVKDLVENLFSQCDMSVLAKAHGLKTQIEIGIDALCQRLEQEVTKRFEGNRISSAEHQEELQALRQQLAEATERVADLERECRAWSVTVDNLEAALANANV